MSAVYVVSRGSYSDYRVEFACTTEQAANDAAAKLNALAGSSYEPYEVEELPLVDSPDQVGATVRYMAHTDRDIVREWSYTEYGVISEVEDELAETSFPVGKGWRATAASPDRARKILADKLAQLRAETELDPQP
ncbi:MAG: hypothetical protein IT357_05135 [Gemmatimonadaceae bacterium]|jgi:hypothetical protein|nr:hypothetical protein [Gemmatimonadaceae bacterium]